MKKLLNTQYTLIIIIFILLYTSCQNQNKKNGTINIKSNYATSDSINFNIPESIMVSDTLKGEIKFKLALDSINLSKNDKRYTFLYVAADSVIISDLDELKTKQHKIFIEKEKGEISFNYVFDKTGTIYLTGIIEDEVHIDNYKDGKTRVITNWIKIVKKIYIKQRKIELQKI